MPSIRKLRGKWQVRWTEVDGSRQSHVCTTRAKAVELVREIEDAHSLRRRWEPAGPRESVTADTAMTAYILDLKRHAAPKTYERHAYALRMFGRFVTEAGHAALCVHELTRALLVDFHAWLSRPGAARHERDRKPGSVRKYVEVVQLWWQWLADESDWAESVPRPRSIRMAVDPSPPAIEPTWAEMDACVAAAFGWRKKLTLCMRSTGLRPSQWMLGKPEDLNLDRGLFVVRHGKSRREKHGRVIPLPAYLVAEMRTWEMDEWIIETGLSTPRERQSRDREMRECWQRAGVREQAWKGSPHKAFRKGVQSGLKALGADDEAVKYLVGHSLGLRGHYIGPSSLPLQQAVALIPAPTVVSLRGVA